MTFQFNPLVRAMIKRSIIEYVSSISNIPETKEDAEKISTDHVRKTYNLSAKGDDYREAVITAMTYHLVEKYELK